MAEGERMQSYIRHREWGSEWPVPTWNLLTARQSIRAAGMKLPERLSASIRAGATLFAMVGDQSHCRREVGNVESFAWRLSGNSEGGARDLPVRPWHRLAVGRCVAQHRIANPCQLIGEGAGALLWLVRACTVIAQVRRPSSVRALRRARLAARKTERAPWVSSTRR